MINKGHFFGKDYVKYVSLSKAVLWMYRELSLPSDILARIQREGITKIKFIDLMKGDMWVFRKDRVFDKGKMKQIGQEPQFYFSIDLANKKHIEKDPYEGRIVS